MNENERIEGYFKILYPNFKELSSEEKIISAENKSLIKKHLNEIDEIVYKLESKQPGSVNKETMMEIIKNMQIEEYFFMLYPAYYSISGNERKSADYDKKVLIENFEEVKKRYKVLIKNTNNIPTIAIKKSINSIKADKIFATVYPEFNKLNSKEKIEAAENKEMIYENIDLILLGLKDISKSDLKLSERAKILKVMEAIQVQKYFKEMYPYYNELSMKEKISAIEDKKFIADNIKEIDKEYKKLIKNQNIIQARYSNAQIIYEIVKNIRIQKLCNQISLYENNSMNPKIIKRAIIEYYEQIESEIKKYNQTIKYSDENKENDKEIFIIVWNVIAKCILEEAYQNWEKINYQEKAEILKDEELILENLQTILERYYNAQNPKSFEQKQGFNNKKILQEIIKSIKIEETLKKLNLTGHKLSSKENELKDAIINNFDRIMENIQYNEKRNIKMSIDKILDIIKMQDYMNILYPNYENFDKEKKEEANRTQQIIIKNIKSIDSSFKGAQRKNSAEQKMGLTDKKILEGIIKSIKVNEYYKILYPSTKLSTQNKIIALNVKKIMAENIEKIDQYYIREVKNNNNISDKDTLSNILNSIIMEDMMNKIYPNYNKLSKEEKCEYEKDRKFIEKNIVEIYNIYLKQMDTSENDEKNVIENIIKSVKVQNIFTKVYPNIKKLTMADRKEAYNTKKIIAYNIDAFENLSDEANVSEIINILSKIEKVDIEDEVKEMKSEAKANKKKFVCEEQKEVKESSNDYTEVIEEVKWKKTLKEKFNFLTKFFKHQKLLEEKNKN